MKYNKVTGTLRPRPNKNNIKYYDAVIELGRDSCTGKREQRYHKIETTDKNEAERQLQILKADYLKGEVIEPSKMTVEEFLNEYVEIYVKDRLAASTCRDYIGTIKNYLNPAFGKCRLQDLDSLKIQKAVNNWLKVSPNRKKPLAPATVHHIIRNLKAVMNKAVELEYILKNPVKGVNIKKNYNNEVDVYTVDEVKELQTAVKGTDMELAVALLFDGVLRRGELLGLCFEDIDFIKRTIYIRRSWVESEDSKCPVLKDCKTDSSNRKIVVSDYTLSLLKKQKRCYEENKLKYGDDFFDSHRVICQKNGKPYLPKSFSRKWSDTLKKYGLRHIKLHGTRHTAISLMLTGKVPLPVVQERAGHKTPIITLSVYSHVAKDNQTIGADFMQNKLFNEIEDEGQ